MAFKITSEYKGFGPQCYFHQCCGTGVELLTFEKGYVKVFMASLCPTHSRYVQEGSFCWRRDLDGDVTIFPPG